MLLLRICFLRSSATSNRFGTSGGRGSLAPYCRTWVSMIAGPDMWMMRNYLRGSTRAFEVRTRGRPWFQDLVYQCAAIALEQMEVGLGNRPPSREK